MWVIQKLCKIIQNLPRNGQGCGSWIFAKFHTVFELLKNNFDKVCSIIIKEVLKSMIVNSIFRMEKNPLF